MSDYRFFFELDNTNFTGKIGVIEAEENIFIPKSITHNFNNFIIKGLLYDTFKSSDIKTISFDDDSQIETIDGFEKCNFHTIKIPSNVISIGIKGFYKCKHLKIVNFSPNSRLKYINFKAFSGASIQSISIPKTVTSIDRNAFSKCKNLKNVIFSKESELETIESNAFSHCAIESIVIPSSVYRIEDSAFSECKNLKSITFDENAQINYIESKFIYNTAITNFEILPNVEKIEPDAFIGANFLINIQVIENSDFLIQKNLLLTKSGKEKDIFDTLFYIVNDSEQIEIPSTIKRFGKCAFNNCSKLKSIQLPKKSNFSNIENQLLVGEGLIMEQDICNMLFFVQKSIQEIIIPSSVFAINNYAFYNCTALKSIKFLHDSSLQIILPNAFDSSSLEVIVFPKLLVIICPFAFKDCYNLKKVDFSETKNVMVVDYAFYNSQVENLVITSDDIHYFEKQIIYVSTLTLIDKTVDLKSSHLLSMCKQVCLPNISSVSVSCDNEDITLIVPKDAEINDLNEDKYNIKINYLPFFMDSEMVDKFLSPTKNELGIGTTAVVYKVKNIFEEEGFFPLKIIKKEICFIQKEVCKKDFWEKRNDENNSDDNEILDITKIKRYFQEYEILSKLYHPNVIRAIAFSFGDEKHLPSILLEYCHSNLKQAIDKLEDFELVCVIFEICSAMKYIHENHIIHRDLKLENILIDFTKHVKISDFGISKLVDSYNQTTYTNGIGTAIFMAPELFRKMGKYDYKVDVYAFGVVLYFILTKGELPEGIPGFLYETTFPSSINPLCSKIIKKCWSVSPDERPSFNEIIEEIVSNNFQIIDGIEEMIPLIKDHLKLEQKNMGSGFFDKLFNLECLLI